MILSPSIDLSSIQKAVEFYKKSYDDVRVIVCSQCNEELGIQVHGAVEGLQPNTLGNTIIAVSPKLLGSRVRLDGVTGYQCACGNDTRANLIEEAGSPTGSFMPHEIAAIQDEMTAQKFEPLVIENGDSTQIESFEVVRIN